MRSFLKGVEYAEHIEMSTRSMTSHDEQCALCTVQAESNYSKCFAGREQSVDSLLSKQEI